MRAGRSLSGDESSGARDDQHIGGTQRSCYCTIDLAGRQAPCREKAGMKHSASLRRSGQHAARLQDRRARSSREDGASNRAAVGAEPDRPRLPVEDHVSHGIQGRPRISITIPYGREPGLAILARRTWPDTWSRWPSMLLFCSVNQRSPLPSKAIVCGSLAAESGMR